MSIYFINLMFFIINEFYFREDNINNNFILIYSSHFYFKFFSIFSEIRRNKASYNLKINSQYNKFINNRRCFLHCCIKFCSRHLDLTAITYQGYF